MLNRKKVLIVGPSSEIANSFFSKFYKNYQLNIDLISMKYQEDPSRLITNRINEFKPDSILYFPYLEPRKFDGNLKLAELINIAIPLEIAKKSLNEGTQFIVFSSTRVFDEHRSFVTKELNKNPYSEYGKIKSQMESELSSTNATILRLTKVLTPRSRIWQEWEKAIFESHTVDIYSRKFISPLFLSEVSDAIFKLISLDLKSEIFQLSRDFELSYKDLFQKFYSSLEIHHSRLDSLPNLKFVESDESHGSLKCSEILKDCLGDFDLNFLELVSSIKSQL